MLDPENHVARLRVFASALSAQRDREPVPDVLAQALGAKPKSVEFHHRVALLAELARRARAQVAALLDGDPNREDYLAVIEKIKDRLDSLDMRENWGASYSSVFDAGPLAKLELCERDVAHRLTSKWAGEEQLEALREDIRAAIDEVEEADIDPEAKQILRELLHDIESAIDAYKISGLAGLRRAAERSFGCAGLYRDKFEAPFRQGKLQKTAAVMGKLLTYARNVEFVRQLAERTGLLQLIFPQ